MITIEKIKIYIKFNGDIENWVRNDSKNEKSRMSDDEFFLIDTFIQDLRLVKKGLTSVQFENNLNSRLKENCDGEQSINKIKNFADAKRTDK
jgi:hypothetical protein